MESSPTIRETARRRVAQELARRGWNASDLSRAAGIDDLTVSTFLSGERWPRRGTRGKIETALGIDPGSLGMVSPHVPEDVGNVPRFDERWNDYFFTTEERSQIAAAGDAAMNQKAQEIARSSVYATRARCIADIAVIVSDIREAVNNPSELWEPEYEEVLIDVLGLADGLEWWTTGPATRNLTDSFPTDVRPMLDAAERFLELLLSAPEGISVDDLVVEERRLTRTMRAMFYSSVPGHVPRAVPIRRT